MDESLFTDIIKEPEPKATNFKKSPSGLWTLSSTFLDAKTTENNTEEKVEEKNEIKSKELNASETASD